MGTIGITYAIVYWSKSNNHSTTINPTLSSMLPVPPPCQLDYTNNNNDNNIDNEYAHANISCSFMSSGDKIVE